MLTRDVVISTPTNRTINQSTPLLQLRLQPFTVHHPNHPAFLQRRRALLLVQMSP
jgi:hypothetical protein